MVSKLEMYPPGSSPEARTLLWRRRSSGPGLNIRTRSMSQIPVLRYAIQRSSRSPYGYRISCRALRRVRRHSGRIQGSCRSIAGIDRKPCGLRSGICPAGERDHRDSRYLRLFWHRRHPCAGNDAFDGGLPKMSRLFQHAIALYWFLVPAERRRSCVFRESCSRHVWRRLEEGLSSRSPGVEVPLAAMSTRRSGRSNHGGHLRALTRRLADSGKRFLPAPYRVMGTKP